jgi:hypothetical protein
MPHRNLRCPALATLSNSSFNLATFSSLPSSWVCVPASTPWSAVFGGACNFAHLARIHLQLLFDLLIHRFDNTLLHKAFALCRNYHCKHSLCRDYLLVDVLKYFLEALDEQTLPVHLALGSMTLALASSSSKLVFTSFFVLSSSWWSFSPGSSWARQPFCPACRIVRLSQRGSLSPSSAPASRHHCSSSSHRWLSFDLVLKYPPPKRTSRL